ncbi:hypothetical protein MMC34_005143 [Xylographa carneopallida]|nr:hypothetical protein [Xylographa carneopallida]
MSRPPFREHASRTIHLPDDDAPAFGYVAEYLYTQTYAPISSSGSDDDDDTHATPAQTAHTLAAVYVLAEKYALDRLKACTLRHLAALLPALGDHPVGFFRAARRVYEGTMGSVDEWFQPSFRQVALRLVPRRGGQAWGEVLGLVGGGGDFAVDLVGVLVEYCATPPHTRVLWWGWRRHGEGIVVGTWEERGDCLRREVGV